MGSTDPTESIRYFKALDAKVSPGLRDKAGQIWVEKKRVSSP